MDKQSYVGSWGALASRIEVGQDEKFVKKETNSIPATGSSNRVYTIGIRRRDASGDGGRPPANPPARTSTVPVLPVSPPKLPAPVHLRSWVQVRVPKPRMRSVRLRDRKGGLGQ